MRVRKGDLQNGSPDDDNNARDAGDERTPFEENRSSLGCIAFASTSNGPVEEEKEEEDDEKTRGLVLFSPL